MTNHVIKVVKNFGPRPYGRYRADGEYSGEAFREDVLVPALREYDSVCVDLTGYNRYGRSFLDEAFGGLIRESGFTLEQLQGQLTFSHNLVKSIVDVIRDRMEAAERDRKGRVSE